MLTLETEVSKFLQTFRNHETKHLSPNSNIPFCCFSRNIPFFSPQNSVNPFGVRCIFPRWKRPKPRGDWATNLPWKMLEDFNGKWWWGFSVRICYCERIECLNFSGASIYDVNPKFSLGSVASKARKKMLLRYIKTIDTKMGPPKTLSISGFTLFVHQGRRFFVTIHARGSSD